MASPRRKRPGADPGPPALHLTRFLPYRLSVLSNTVSHTVATLYEKRFGITIPEWRVIAVLGGGETLSAGEIAQRTAMDKVQVSRAISRMLDSALILRESGDTDRRKAQLTLTPKALAIYTEIVPLALAYEQELTGALTEEETAQLDRLLARLKAQADALAARSTQSP
ncbi:MarR family winged helix-turn-helix transcriptional regulator [Azospirillum isscasi]|uniref:MarR family winged helix-turn-helix transcriptional regulator n=1 Tax=Azospirillum isscasi TaxID=3053926 RepID=A0ABU0WLS6_9PROT|nr:MarR family winged helix-turn-helix transcriptional regulator [Azospirillum isscasi]MDQ2105194.1 MarR family winged helix-turn-helix transcriptional regulator [Azospirillum isscasi]